MGVVYKIFLFVTTLEEQYAHSENTHKLNLGWPWREYNKKLGMSSVFLVIF